MKDSCERLNIDNNSFSNGAVSRFSFSALPKIWQTFRISNQSQVFDPQLGKLCEGKKLPCHRSFCALTNLSCSLSLVLAKSGLRNKPFVLLAIYFLAFYDSR